MTDQQTDDIDMVEFVQRLEGDRRLKFGVSRATIAAELCIEYLGKGKRCKFPNFETMQVVRDMADHQGVKYSFDPAEPLTMIPDRVNIECNVSGCTADTTQLSSCSTYVAYMPFEDKAGVYHDHDGNDLTITYRCLNGHEFTMYGTQKCPNCDWGGMSYK